MNEFCHACGCKLPENLEFEAKFCFICSFGLCEVCDEIIGVNDPNKSNCILGNDWVEMCNECAKEFYENRKTNYT